MNASPEFELRDLPCGACGSARRKHLGWRGGNAHQGGQGVRVEIVRCETCRHLYPHPMPFPRREISSLYNDTESYFSAHDIEEKKRIGRESIKNVEQKLGGRGRLLDVGCGRGEMLWAAREAGWEFEGVDVSPAHLAWARANFGIDARLGALEQIRFPEEHFDAVIMGGVIEHLYEPFSTLREVFRVLKPGGVFFFDAPNEDGLYMRVGNFYMRVLGRDWVVNLAPTFAPYHVQGFNRSSVQRLIQRVGLEVTDFTVAGEISPQTGSATLRKRIERSAAQAVNWLGNQFGAGIYMYIWTKKSD